MTTLDVLMTTPPVTARSAEPLAAVVRRMHDRRVGSVIVVEDDVVAGIVTERDVLRASAAQLDTTAPVGSVMTTPADCLDASTPIADALAMMRERGYRHMPVTVHGHPVGVISLRDLMRVAQIGPTEVPRGLKGVVVADTEVGDVRGQEGFYHYRQYSAVELAERRSIDDVWRLLIDGALPATAAERDAFAAEIAARRSIPASMRPVLPAIAAASPPLEAVRTALSLAAADHRMRPVLDIDGAQRRDDALFLTALAPTLLCALHRLRTGREVVEPRQDLGHAANYLWMLTGEQPTPERARAIEQYLVSTIDHGFNASTFTARVVASTGADMGAAIVAAVGALSGPLHGGAPSRALALLDQIGTVDRIDDVVAPMIRRGDKIMGFGHAVYTTDDPRSVMLRGVARRLAAVDPAAVELVSFTERVEERVVTLLDELKPGRRLRTNVEFYAGVVMELCGIPRDMFTPTFASSRVIGWCANVLEQAADTKIIRPSARYVGPPPPQPIPRLV
jgi:citrate synthase